MFLCFLLGESFKRVLLHGHWCCYGSQWLTCIKGKGYYRWQVKWSNSIMFLHSPSFSICNPLIHITSSFLQPGKSCFKLLQVQIMCNSTVASFILALKLCHVLWIAYWWVRVCILAVKRLLTQGERCETVLEGMVLHI